MSADTPVGGMAPASRIAQARNRTPAKMWSNPFDGASTDAYSSRFTTWESTPDEEISQALPVLRARSSDLYRNDPIAYGILDTIAHNVIGRGPRLRSLAKGDAVSDRIDALFAEWTESAGWDGVSTWADICNGLVNGANISGDILAVWPDIGDGSGVHVDLIDARRIDSPSTHPECETCRLGVGYDKYGRVQGYYVRKDADLIGAGGKREDFYWFPLVKDGRPNAFLFRRPGVNRPRQSRGLPLLAPALHDLKDLREFRRTETRRATQASKIHMIIQSPDPKQIADAFENLQTETGSDGAIDALLGRSYGKTPDGTILSLGIGETGAPVQIPALNGGVGDYVESMLRAIAPCTGYPYEEVFRLYAKINFSNAKGIQLMSKAATKDWRDAMTPRFLKPTARMLVVGWWASGLLGQIPFTADLLAHEWAWDEREWIDFTREVKANTEAVATGQRSIVDIVSAAGKDAYKIIDENLKVEKYEAEQRAKLGLPAKALPGAPAPVAAVDDDEADDATTKNGGNDDE